METLTQIGVGFVFFAVLLVVLLLFVDVVSRILARITKKERSQEHILYGWLIVCASIPALKVMQIIGSAVIEMWFR